MSERSDPQPRVTWLLAVRNGMPWLPETLASIEAQTYRNHEILVWENGSTDGTLEELRKWVPSRIEGRVVIGEPLRLGASLARAVTEARTELCARIDADDICHPRRLEKQVAFMLAHPEIGLCGSNIEFIDEEGKVRPCPDSYPLEDADVRWAMRWRNPIAHPAVIFRRSVVLAAGNYEDLQPYEDYDLWFRMAMISGIANLPEVLLKYRKHGASITALASADYFQYFRAVAERHADQLFRGIPGPEALALRQKAVRDSDLPVALADLRLYARAAHSAAVDTGKPADYFSRTASYHEYRRELIRNLVIRHPAGRWILALKRCFH